MEVYPVPVNSDNYCYLVVDEASKEAAVVDVCEAEKVLKAADDAGVKRISTILTTHDHWDHCAGNVDMVELLKKRGSGKVTVVGGKNDSVPGANQLVQQGDMIEVGKHVQVHCIDTPCHTPGHVCFLATCEDQGSSSGEQVQHVFTGDTLFVGGCGNLNRGTPQQMKEALVDKLMFLPTNTKVWVGHEYTVKNLSWAIEVEPQNEDVKKKLEHAKELRSRDEPTVPSTIADELKTNPFVRCTQTPVQQWARTTDPTECLRIVREGKDKWGKRAAF